MSEQQKITEMMQQAFAELCNENPPSAFLAVTVGNDMMVNFATLGIDDIGTIELLEHMLEYIKAKESEDDFGREDDTTIH